MWKIVAAELNYHKYTLLVFVSLIFIAFSLFGVNYSDVLRKSREDNTVQLAVNDLQVYINDGGLLGKRGIRFDGKMIMPATGLWLGGRVNDDIQTTIVKHVTSQYTSYTNPILTDSWGDRAIQMEYKSNSPSVDVKQIVYAFSRGGVLDQTVFFKYQITNTGNYPINEAYLSFWSDPDIGDPVNDLVGCDVDLDLGYCYNISDWERYTPPVIGYKLLQGPINDAGKELAMTSFNRYNYGADPQSPLQTYHYLNGRMADGTSHLNPSTGDTTLYSYSGDPITKTGWIDMEPADRRILLNSGPFIFLPNETKEFVVAVMVAQEKGRNASLNQLRSMAIEVQQLFDDHFSNLPPLKPIPDVQRYKETPIVWLLFLLVVLAITFIATNSVVSTRQEEKRGSFDVLLPISLQHLAIVRVLLMMTPAVVISILLTIVIFFLKDIFPITSNLLILGMGIVFTAASLYFIISDISSLIFRRSAAIINKGIAIAGLLLLNVVGVILLVYVKKTGTSPIFLSSVIDFIQAYNPFGGMYGGVKLLIFSLILAYLSLISFKHRKSYLS